MTRHFKRFLKKTIKKICVTNKSCFILLKQTNKKNGLIKQH